MFDLTGKIAVVTGAASGIGRAIAETFARQGAQVAVLDVDLDAAAATVGAIERAGGLARPVGCDVRDAARVNDAFAEIDQQCGPLDILVNNAGIAHVGTVADTAEEDLDRVYAVNVKGVFHCTKAAIERMTPRGAGVLLNVASIASMIGVAERFAYSMSKGAVLTMTLSTAIDYVAKGIRCNCICPSRIHTPLVDGFLAANYAGREAEMMEKLSAYQPVGRMGTPAEVAALALYLCSDEAGFVTGAAYPLDGGVLTSR